MADEPGDDVFALFGDRALGRVWVPDLLLQAGESLRSVLEGKDQENLAHLHKKYPGVALKVNGDISTKVLPDKRLHISILCRERDVLDRVTADVRDLIESVCEHVADNLGIDADCLEQAFVAIRMKKYVFSVEREEDDEESEEEDGQAADECPKQLQTRAQEATAQVSESVALSTTVQAQQHKAVADDDKGRATTDPIVIHDVDSGGESPSASTRGSDEEDEEEEEEDEEAKDAVNDSASEMPQEARHDKLDSALSRKQAFEYTDTDGDMLNSTDAEDARSTQAPVEERNRLSPAELAKIKSQQRNEIRSAAVANLTPSNGKSKDGMAPSGLQAAVADMLARKCSPNWIVGSLKAKGYSLEQALTALKAIAVAKLQKPSIIECSLDSDSDEEEAPSTLPAVGYDQLPAFLKARLPKSVLAGGEEPSKMEAEQTPMLPLLPKAQSPASAPPGATQASRPRMSSQQLIAATSLLGPGFEDATPEQLVVEFKKRGFTPADVVSKLKELQEASLTKKAQQDDAQAQNGLSVKQDVGIPQEENQEEKQKVEAPPWDSWEAGDSQWEWPEQQQAWNAGWEETPKDGTDYQTAWRPDAAWGAAQNGVQNQVYPALPPGLGVNQSGVANVQQQSAWPSQASTWAQGQQQWPTASRHPLAVKKEQEEDQWPGQTSSAGTHALANTAGWSKLQTLIWMQQQRQQQALAMQQQRQQQQNAVALQQQQQSMVQQQQQAVNIHQHLQHQALLAHQQRHQQALAMQQHMQQQAQAASSSKPDFQRTIHEAIINGMKDLSASGGERIFPSAPNTASSLLEVKTEGSSDATSSFANASAKLNVKMEQESALEKGTRIGWNAAKDPHFAAPAVQQNFSAGLTQVKQETMEAQISMDKSSARTSNKESDDPSRNFGQDASSTKNAAADVSNSTRAHVKGLANATLQSFSEALTQVKQEIQEAAAQKPTEEELQQKRKDMKDKVAAREKEAKEKIQAMYKATNKRESSTTKVANSTEPGSIVAVRSEAAWSDLKSKWSIPTAPKNWTSMFSCGSNGKPRNLRIFKGDVEVRSLTLVHPCVIIGASLETAHVADFTHESVQPQHAALLWGSSGHFSLEPFGGKVRVSSLQTHPDIASLMAREGRTLPNDEEKSIELPMGSGKQLLFASRCCFQMAASEIVFMVDLLPLPTKQLRNDERRRASASRSPSSGARKISRRRKSPCRRAGEKKRSPLRRHSRSPSRDRSLQNRGRSRERGVKDSRKARPRSRSAKSSPMRSPSPIVDRKKRKLNLKSKDLEKRSPSRRKDRKREGERAKEAAKSSKLMTLMTEVKSEEETEIEEDAFAAQEKEWRSEKSTKRKEEKASDNKAKAIEKRVASKTDSKSSLETRKDDGRDTRHRDGSREFKRKREDDRRSPRSPLKLDDEKRKDKPKDAKEHRTKKTDIAKKGNVAADRDSKKDKKTRKGTIEEKEVKSEPESGDSERQDKCKSGKKAKNALFAGDTKDEQKKGTKKKKRKGESEGIRRSPSKSKKEQRRYCDRDRRASRSPPRKTVPERRGKCKSGSSASSTKQVRSRGSCETRTSKRHSS